MCHLLMGPHVAFLTRFHLLFKLCELNKKIYSTSKNKHMDLQEIPHFLLCSCDKVTPGCSCLMSSVLQANFFQRVVFFYVMKHLQVISPAPQVFLKSKPLLLLFEQQRWAWILFCIGQISGGKESSLKLQMIFWSVNASKNL